MKWLEEEIARNERRIKKIAENPDPTKMRCNKMLYELELGLRKAQLEAAREGKGCLVAGNIMFESILRALGLLPLDLQGAADRLMAGDQYLEIATAAGFPDNHCDRTVAYIGMCLSGALPVPNLIVASNSACDPLYLGLNALAHHFDIPVFCLDVALEENEDTLSYVADQLRELIAFIEATIPGTKYDEDELVELHELNRQALDYIRDIYQMRKEVPCPVPVEDTFRLPRFPASYPDSTAYLEYVRAFRDELRERAGKIPMPQERLRVMWTCNAPYFANPFPILTQRGASIPIFQIDTAARWSGGRGKIYGDEEYGRKLSPLEEEARMLYSAGWVGYGKKWVGEVLEVCRDLKIDAIVNFQQIGCTPTAGLGKLLADAAEGELGIPTLNIEGRQLMSDAYNKAQFEGALAEFIDMCLLRKGEK